MKGNPKVISALQEALREELTAINQYFLHAEMCENWHYSKLGDFIKKQSIDEMKHAEELIERILFLDGTPSLTEPMRLTIGKDVRSQLQSVCSETRKSTWTGSKPSSTRSKKLDMNVI